MTVIPHSPLQGELSINQGFSECMRLLANAKVLRFRARLRHPHLGELFFPSRLTGQMNSSCRLYSRLEARNAIKRPILWICRNEF